MNIGEKLRKLRNEMTANLKEQERLVKEAFPLGSQVTCLKGSERGWAATVTDHGYGTDLRVKNNNTGNEQRVEIYWIKEAGIRE